MTTNPGNEFTRSRRRLTLKKFKLRKIVNNNRQRLIMRFQGLTNFDTNSGYFSLPNWVNATTGYMLSPLHMYDITTVPNQSTVTQLPAARWYGYSGTGADANPFHTILQGQTNESTVLSDKWNPEKGNIGPYRADTFHHDWTSVRMNLYGARKRTTYFDIMFVRFSQDYANLWTGNSSNPDLKQLFAYLVRPLMFSNLNTFRPNVSKNITIVKKFRHYIEPQQTIDLNTTTGKIKEVNIFIRHNTKYKLDYAEGQTIPGISNVDIVDYPSDISNDNNNSPMHKSRMFMIVRAFAPEQRIGEGSFPTMDPAIDPSYDIIIRNAVSIQRCPAN